MFFLNNKTGDHYEVEFEPLAGESEIIIDDLTIICGLKREYPKGKIVPMRGSRRGNGTGDPDSLENNAESYPDSMQCLAVIG